MVGGDGIQCAVQQSLDHGLPVIFCAKGRVHPVVGVPLFQLFMGHHEVMGTGFGSNGNPALFRVPNHIHRSAGAHMADVHRHPIGFRHGDFPGCTAVFGGGGNPRHAQLPGNTTLVHNAALCQIQILAVGRDRQPQRGRSVHGIRQKAGVFHRPAVVTQGNGSGFGQCFPVAGLLTFQALGHGRCYIHMSVRIFCFIQNIFHRFRGIGGRIGVGHGQQTGHAACRSSTASGENIFLLGKARVPQVNVHVHQTGSRHQPFGLDDPCAGQLTDLPHGGNFSVTDGDVADIVFIFPGVHNMCAPNQQVFHPIAHPFRLCLLDLGTVGSIIPDFSSMVKTCFSRREKTLFLQKVTIPSTFQ